jgi:GMP synthase (glutamine-hydrolysing)
MASSQMYKNQAFRLGNQAVGLQFHIEVTPEDIEGWISAYRDELKSEGLNESKILGNESLWKRLKIYCDVFTEYLLKL